MEQTITQTDFETDRMRGDKLLAFSLRFPHKAVFVGKLPDGRKVYRVPYIVRHNSSRDCCTVLRRAGTILACSAKDAANAIRDEHATTPETEIAAFGPRGGRVDRYVGFESAIFAQICARPAVQSLKLDF